MVMDAALNVLEESLAINRHLVRQIAADRDLDTVEATGMLIVLERERLELLRGLRVLNTYTVKPAALIVRAA